MKDNTREKYHCENDNIYAFLFNACYVFQLLLVNVSLFFKRIIYCTYNIELLGNRFTKVNRLSSESLFCISNYLYVNFLYYMYTCCYTINKKKSLN